MVGVDRISPLPASGQAPPRLVYTESSWALLAGTRFVLAMIVMLAHVSIFTTHSPAALGTLLVAFDSKSAVVGFLLISGVSIGYSYRQRPEGYYPRRFLRIYPLYFFAVALGQALVYLVGSPYPMEAFTFRASGWKTGLGNFLLLQDFAVIALPYNVPLWTLSIEVFFYLWAPLLARMRPGVTAALAVASMGVFATGGHLWLYGYLAACYAWPWLTGFLLAYRGWTPATVSLAVAGSFLPLLHPAEIRGPLCWVVIGGTAVVLWSASRLSIPTALRTALNFLGEQSYPLYLFHIPLGLAFYHYAGLRNYWLLVAAILPTVVVLDVVLDRWLKNLLWEPLVARLTGLRRVKITSAVATASRA